MKNMPGGVAAYRAAEGKSVETPYRGAVDNTMGEIMGGLRSMMDLYRRDATTKKCPSARLSCA